MSIAPQTGLTGDLRELPRIMWRRRWLMFIPWAVAIVVGLLAAFLLPPVYFSNVTLLLQQPQQLVGNLGGVSGGPTPDQQADLMREQVKSSLFLSSVITSSGIRNDPATREWAKRHGRHYAGLSENDNIDAFLIDYLRDAVSIKRGKGNVFQITVADRDRERARRLAEGVANQFVASSKQSQLEAAKEVQEFSTSQQLVYKRQLDDAEARLESYSRGVISSNQIDNTVNPGNVARARTLVDQASFEAEDLRQRIANASKDLDGKARANDAAQLSGGQVTSLMAQMTSLERQAASAQLNEAGNDVNSGSLRLNIVHKQAELEVELGVNAARVFPTLPASTRDALVQYRLLQADLAGVEARRAWLQGQVGGFEQNVVMTPDREIERQRLSQDVENKRSLYNSFLQQSAIAQITEAFQNAKVSGHFVVLEPANRPRAPSKPNRPILLLLSLIAGGIVGAGTVLVVEHHDQSVKNAEEVENLLGLPVLGAVPRVPELERTRRRARPVAGTVGTAAPRDHGLLHRLKVESPLGLEFRRTYLKLAKARGRSLPRSLVVTSATRGEGKTTTTACLAITLARELREKVLLVDFDLRSPALHRALGLPTSSWGLAQMLHQRHFDERFVRQTVVPHLEFLPAGKSERPASELIDIDAVEWFVQEATSRYPLVIIDSAPNLAVPDPLILGRAAEGVLYVIKAGSTIRKAAEYGVKVQREARENVLGVLINDAGEILPHYYGYRYNYYGYTNEAAGTDA